MDASIREITFAYFERCSKKLKNSNAEMTILGKIESGFRTVQIHHSLENIEKTLEIIPVDEIHNRTNKLLQESDGKITHTEALVKVLLAWFKNEFFKWCDTVPCSACNGKTISIGGTRPTFEEAGFKASITELHKCSICNLVNRFPRYNDPIKLLQTRKGRCGEWANCFGMILTSMGLEARYVLDFTDHVWNEVYCDGEWKHCDSCENAFSTPLVYEQGWGKKLSYCFSFGLYQVVDSTRRYTLKYEELLSRRNLITETGLYLLLQRVNFNKMQSLPLDFRAELEDKEKKELDFLLSEAKKVMDSASLIPRQSGDLNWRLARGEMG